MIKTIKIMLVPNNKQNTRLFECSGVSRWAYNWTLDIQQGNHKLGNEFISDNDLRKKLTQLKKTDYIWLNQYSNNITKQAIKDACDSYKRFFKGYSSFPRFKSRKKSKPSFYVDSYKINFTKTHVRLEKLSLSTKKNKAKFNWVRLAEKDRIPCNKDVKYINPRITFDGLHWWISVGVEYLDNTNIPDNEGIGIDLGIKELAIVSDGSTYKNINKSNKVKKLEKRKVRLQRSISRKYIKNKKGVSYCKTKNILKNERELKRIQQRLNGIRRNYLHQTTSTIVNRKPMFIVLEDLNVKGMMKNKYLSKAIQQQGFYEFRRQIEYKSLWKNIEVVIANRWFPSSKLCSECGNTKRNLKLSDRIYTCECGNIINRDMNASINLRNYHKLTK